MPLAPDVQAASYRLVPEGNRNKAQPEIPFASARRTAASSSSYDAKFQRVLAVLRSDRQLIADIKRVAARYKIDPIHMIGAIVGEHTYNYDTLDSAQSYYVKALSYAGVPLRFQYNGEPVSQFVQRPQFERCRKNGHDEDSNALWTCYENTWNATFRGKTVDGTRFPRLNFNEAFFQPLFAGQSFGLGQLSPLTILKMTDSVARQSRFKRLNADDAREVYQATMDPNISLHYMAAIIQDSIEAYRVTARVDISGNPGITATLYNLGDPWGRAARFRASGNAWPQENYYGWLVNDRLEDLKGLL
ncbi:DUF1402 family protein [Polymorphum gilvum]|uniref:DUF1402 family protein n=1 Tax=Polymorphum gilvum TaxID=991904 RepID=UPI001F572CFE|nr:DUF1402 family protein [Polymorphum gilvum]